MTISKKQQKGSNYLIRIQLISFLLCFGIQASPLFAQDRLQELLGDGSVLLHSPTDEVLLSLNPNVSLLPASIIKIPLAQVAFTVLGEEFRFETHFYSNDEGDLLVRGLGDPFLVSEEVELISNALSELGLTTIRRLVVDDSAFESNLDLPLENGALDPYAARNTALAVNFNTVNLAWDASGALISGEPQTPLTEQARELAAGLSSHQDQRINLGADPDKGLRQVHEIFTYFLKGSGITVNDESFYHDTISEQWSVIYKHQSSRTLRDNVDGLLRYSNNFIANQIFLVLGSRRFGFPVNVDQALEVLRGELVRLYGEGFGSSESSLLMREGSGLARSQRATASAMMSVLKSFKPYAELLPEQNGVLRKSGTLTGVYNYVGYIRGGDGLYPFVILSNQPANNRSQILELLKGRI